MGWQAAEVSSVAKPLQFQRNGIVKTIPVVFNQIHMRDEKTEYPMTKWRC